MSAATSLSGAVVFLLGLIGLVEIYGYAVLPVNLAIISSYLTTDGALVLFGLITVVGIWLIVGGIVTPAGGRQGDAVPPTVVVATPLTVQIAPTQRALQSATDLEFVVLRYVMQGRTVSDMATLTGASEETIREKMAKLRSDGYLTESYALTEKGFEVLRAPDQPPLYASPG